LLKEWPAAGPPLLWKTNGIGQGYTAPVIHQGVIYIAGELEDELRISALDPEGRRLWFAKNGEAWKGPYPGARASCTIRDGRLFHLNAHGRLAAFDARTGKELWQLQIRERFGGKVNTWAFSEAVLVHSNRVLVTAGGTKALMAALDVRTGDTVWASEPLLLGPDHSTPDHVRVPEPPGEADSASYASPIIISFAGRPLVIGCSQRHVFGLDANSGRLLWSRPLRTRYGVIAATPVLVGDSVFVTAPDTGDARLYRLLTRSPWVEERWSTRLDTCHGGVIYRGDCLFGSWYRNSKGYACVDADTGQVRFSTDQLAKGSILWADERLYCLAEDGQMALLKPGQTSFEFAGRFRLISERKSDVWTHPVVSSRRLYLRSHDIFYCYDVQRRPQ
jgi:outer membrane protein assembly factor BamB